MCFGKKNKVHSFSETQYGSTMGLFFGPAGMVKMDLIVPGSSRPAFLVPPEPSQQLQSQIMHLFCFFSTPSIYCLFDAQSTNQIVDLWALLNEDLRSTESSKFHWKVFFCFDAKNKVRFIWETESKDWTGWIEQHEIGLKWAVEPDTFIW